MEQVKNSTKIRMNVKSQMMGIGDGLNEMRDSSMSRKDRMISIFYLMKNSSTKNTFRRLLEH